MPMHSVSTLASPMASPESTARAAASASTGSRLAAGVAGLAIGAVHLNDGAAGRDQKAGKAGTIRSGAFDAEAWVAAQAAGPLQQPAVPGRRGRDCQVSEWPAEVTREGGGDVRITVGVDADGGATIAVLNRCGCEPLAAPAC
jgi:hypothetical protein